MRSGRLDAVSNAERFLQVQRRARPGVRVRLITGRGQSGGGAPVRRRVGALLRRLKEEGQLVRDYELDVSAGSYLVWLTG